MCTHKHTHAQTHTHTRAVGTGLAGPATARPILQANESSQLNSQVTLKNRNKMESATRLSQRLLLQLFQFYLVSAILYIEALGL